MYRRTFAILISVLAVAAIAAGCGGDDSSSSLTKAEFVAQSEDMCKQIRKEVQAELKPFIAANAKNSPKETEEKLLTAIVVPTLQKEVDEFEEIGAPEGEEEQFDAIVVGLEKVIQTGEEDFAGWTAATDPFREVDQELKAFGLEVCRH